MILETLLKVTEKSSLTLETLFEVTKKMSR